MRQKGAQIGNLNARKHGLFSPRLPDKRTREGRTYDAILSGLVELKGGHPSAAEMILIGQAATGFVKSHVALERSEADPENRWKVEVALKWRSDLRNTLRLLGLNERRPDVQSLQQYIDAKGTTPAQTATK